MFWSEYPRDVVEMHGSDAFTYLQSQVSQQLMSGSAWSFLLQPTGKVDVLVRITRAADDRFVLDTDAGFGDVLVARLNRFKIRVKADIAPLDWRCIAVRGTAERPEGSVVAWGDGYDLLGPDPQPPAGVPEGDLHAARVAAAWPAMGSEIVPGETIPAETGVVPVSVSFTKGCYPGQELVERMDSRGATAPRSLRLVHVPAGTLPGDVVDGAVVTSVAGEQALAYVKRGAQ